MDRHARSAPEECTAKSAGQEQICAEVLTKVLIERKRITLRDDTREKYAHLVDPGVQCRI